MPDFAKLETEAEICRILPTLSQKIVVDFANGIDVARDQIRAQKNRSGVADRLWDAFTGKGSRRQASINQCLADGLEGALEWLTCLTDQVALGHLALSQVCERIGTIQENVVQLASFSWETRSRLDALDKQMQNRCTELQRQIDRVDLENRAHRQMELLFQKWEAGELLVFSPAGQLCAVLEELHWGHFGDLCRSSTEETRSEYMKNLEYKIMKQFRSMMDDPSTRHLRDVWFSPPVEVRSLPGGEDAPEALAYLLDWTQSNTEPFAFSASQNPLSPPLDVPVRFDGPRLGRELTRELLERRLP